MHATIKLGRIFGIPIGLHYSWFIIATLITLSLGLHFTALQPDWTPLVIWTSAVVTAILFFASLVVHELSHAIVAQSVGLPVRSITLFALGGLAQIEKEAATAKNEFWIAVVGPLTSVAIGIACIGTAVALGWDMDIRTGASTVGAAVLGWLGYINVVLALFNMIPAFPLDGGRVLRSILWYATGSATRATRQAALVGQGAAFLFIFLGLLVFFRGAGFGGLWLAFIGWFLLQAAQASCAQVSLTEGLRDVRVADVMGSDCATVDGRWSLQQFVDDLLLRSGRRCFLVQRGENVIGLITPNEVRNVDRETWGTTAVATAARPLQTLHTVSPETPAGEALKIMSEEDVHQLPVMLNGHLKGIVTRGHVLQLIQTRTTLNL
ncbi:MAG: site-2 protease family protein [Vicinamibacteraceae bacterium]